MPDATTTLTLAAFLEARLSDDEAAARVCLEMFPTPWEISDRGWRVRIYASEIPTEDFTSDDAGAMTVRHPVVMEVEPDRHIEDPHWLSERVAHIARHDPARVLAEVASKREIMRRARRERRRYEQTGGNLGNPIEEVIAYEMAVRVLAAVYSDHAEFQEAWRA